MRHVVHVSDGVPRECGLEMMMMMTRGFIVLVMQGSIVFRVERDLQRAALLGGRDGHLGWRGRRRNEQFRVLARGHDALHVIVVQQVDLVLLLRVGGCCHRVMMKMVVVVVVVKMVVGVDVGLL